VHLVAEEAQGLGIEAVRSKVNGPPLGAVEGEEKEGKVDQAAAVVESVEAAEATPSAAEVDTVMADTSAAPAVSLAL
jgi:hypothetical protein